MLIQQLLTVDKDVKSLLYTWGRNNYSQLGLGTTIIRSSSIQIGASSWTAVSLGSLHTLAINSSGQLYAWGNNSSGEVGDGTTINRSSPVLVTSASWTWSKISAGFGFSMAISSSGALWAWGINSGGRLGTGNTTARSVPIQIGTGSAQTGSWTAVSAGNGHVAAIRSDGLLFTWGYGTSGQLGDGTLVNKSSPVQIGTNIWTSVSAGNGHVLAISSSGALFGWGLGTSGQLGDNTTTTKSSPVQIGTGSAQTGSWTAVSAGNIYTLAIRSDGLLFAWGGNLYGKLGDGTQTTRSSPVQIGASSWSAVFAGSNNSSAIRSDGALFTWGGNREGVLGDGTIANKSSPVQIGVGSTWVSASVSISTPVATALSSSGALFMWGSNKFNQFNNLLRVQEEVPLVIPPTARSWKVISTTVFGTHTLAIRSDGLLFAWGGGNNGQIGDSTSFFVKPTIAQIGSSSWTAVAAGEAHSMAIRSDGALFGWGLNAFGQVGDGTTTQRASPVQINAGSSWIAVTAGASHTVAISASNQLFVWGSSGFGQLGDGTTVAKSSPIQIGASSWSAVSAGFGHTLAIRSDGAMFAWGLNGNGTLGDGTSVNKSSPIQIGTGSAGTGNSWNAVAASYRHSLAIRSDGLLFAWGASESGQLGDGTIASKSSPVQIGASSWTVVRVGSRHSVALRSDGALFTWGQNRYGQIGNGTVTNTSSPVQIGTLSWTVISAGRYSTLALTGNLSNIQKNSLT